MGVMGKMGVGARGKSLRRLGILAAQRPARLAGRMSALYAFGRAGAVLHSKSGMNYLHIPSFEAIGKKNPYQRSTMPTGSFSGFWH